MYLTGWLGWPPILLCHIRPPARVHKTPIRTSPSEVRTFHLEPPFVYLYWDRYKIHFSERLVLLPWEGAAPIRRSCKNLECLPLRVPLTFTGMLVQGALVAPLSEVSTRLLLIQPMSLQKWTFKLFLKKFLITTMALF